MTKNISIIGSCFPGLHYKCGQLFQKFSADDAEEFEAKCSAGGLEYEIKNRNVKEKSL